MALGMSRAGWEHVLLVEWDRDAVSAVEHNRKRGISHVSSWPIKREDVRKIDWKPYRGTVGSMGGGPPCQPFGIGGKKRGHEDDRDMWPETARAVRIVDPHVFTFENVRNLAGPKFKGYLEWVKETLRRPHHPREEGETHNDHLARLRAMAEPAYYEVDHLVVNAADYGAPQIRHRVLIRGVRAAAGIPLAPLLPTHSRDRLLWDQWVSGEYWKRHGLRRPSDREIPKADRSRVQKLRAKPLAPPPGLPWLTVRDAIAGLGEPNGQSNHVLQVGAKAYKGHTGSPLDMPAKALKAGDHGVPGGENMMVLPDGSVRYFTAREAARLVNLPDDYHFPASWTETMRGLGNAVPAALGEAIGQWLMAMTNAVEMVPVPQERPHAG